MPSQNLATKNHPLVGTWEEVDNPIHKTTVTFTIRVLRGRFVVTGIDEEDGLRLEISNTEWDGKDLRFTSYFPPTKHEAVHTLRLYRKGRIHHEVSYTETCVEVWKKRPDHV